MDREGNAPDASTGPELDAAEYMEQLQRLAEGTFWTYLGAKLDSADREQVTISLHVEDHHLNLIGILHGGVHASLLDNAMGIAAMLERQGEKVVTTNLTMHYLAPMKTGRVQVTGRIVHQSRSVITTQGEIRDEEGSLGSWCSASYRVL